MKITNKIILGLIILAFFGSVGYCKLISDTTSNAKSTPNHQVVKTKEFALFQSGDIIFQTSKSSQSKAIQLATGSVYSHMGIVYKRGADYYVYEAVQPVKLTPLKQWIDRGKDKHFVLKRLKNATEILTPQALKKMKEVGDRYKGKNYDLLFEWSDDKMYCSELVWKIYKEALDIEIGNLETLSNFDLSPKLVKQKMKERYGTNIPLNEKVISPVAMFESKYLIRVDL